MKLDILQNVAEKISALVGESTESVMNIVSRAHEAVANLALNEVVADTVNQSYATIDSLPALTLLALAGGGFAYNKLKKGQN